MAVPIDSVGHHSRQRAAVIASRSINSYGGGTLFRELFDVWYFETLDALDAAIAECSDEVWRLSMWDVAKDPEQPRALTPDGAPHPLGNGVLSAVWRVTLHALAANESNLNWRPPNWRTTFSSASWLSPTRTDHDMGGIANVGQRVPVDAPSRDELRAYLEHNRRLVDSLLDAAREIGDGQSTLGSWTGPTATLLRMFHGNACHLVAHRNEVGMFVQQQR